MTPTDTTFITDGHTALVLFFGFIALPLIIGIIYFVIILLRIAWGIAWRVAFGFLGAGIIGLPVVMILGSILPHGSIQEHLKEYGNIEAKKAQDAVKYLNVNGPVIDFCTKAQDYATQDKTPFCKSITGKELWAESFEIPQAKVYNQWVREGYIKKNPDSFNGYYVSPQVNLNIVFPPSPK